MIQNMDIKFNTLEPLPLSPKGYSILDGIERKLKALLDYNEKSCLSENFKNKFSDILKQFSEYQREVLHFSNLKKCCKKGCSYCCFHWVEDVNSFEMEIIADHIKRKMPEKIEKIIKTCKADIEKMERLDEIVDNKLSKLSENEISLIDPVDLLLTAFYQLKRRCPLLSPDGTCMVYNIRPITCRIYMNFFNPMLCKPDYINKEEVTTYLLDLDEKSNSLLDQLHFRYLRFSDDTGLRSLLVKYLENNTNT